MNENINLCEILKGHEGKAFYCSLLGKNVYLKTIIGNELIFDYPDSAQKDIDVFSNGAYYIDGECIIFPSKDQRDWNKWVEEQKPKTHKTWDNIPFSMRNPIGEHGDILHNFDKSAIAFLKICQLIEISYGGIPTIEYRLNPNNTVYVPDYIPSDISSALSKWSVCEASFYIEPIAFYTGGQCKEFLSYPENIKLLEEFYML